MALLRRSAERSTVEFGSAPCCSRRRATSCQPAATASSRRFGSAPAASRIAARIFSEQLLHPRRVSPSRTPCRCLPPPPGRSDGSLLASQPNWRRHRATLENGGRLGFEPRPPFEQRIDPIDPPQRDRPKSPARNAAAVVSPSGQIPKWSLKRASSSRTSASWRRSRAIRTNPYPMTMLTASAP